MSDKLYIVVPCYNEQEVLPETAGRLEKKMTELISSGKISSNSRVIFVNDGSTDGTWGLVEDLHAANPLFSGVNMTRNRGHQNALLAGLMTVREYADMTVSMDADLQDDIDALDEMIEKYYGGADIVYGVRKDRSSDSFFKRVTAQGFYRLMSFMGAQTVYNHADYRLMSRRALDGLSGYREVNLFLRGLVPLIGYPSAIVYYDRAERFAGTSKYPLKKMLNFAIDGITSLSTKPIRMVTALGCAVFLASLVILVYSLIRHAAGATVAGWTFLAVSIWGIGGLHLLALGVIGEYIGKIYLETKARPRFAIERFLDAEHGDRTGEASCQPQETSGTVQKGEGQA
ncbi:MAG: glycosyltransferase family 2 protein [Synergistaceae bacterium]|nr:glycosyltransferase family 2 protein [Synergistaceae bacterium]